MLLELRVENYAIIDQVAVEFGPGLNLVTGETGAGKSILIDALTLLMGEKASPEGIRHGAERASVSGVFQFEGQPLREMLEANGIDCPESEQQLILRREIAANGRNRVFINNQPATVAVLKQLAPRLVTIHAQHESLLSFDAASRLELLDAFAECDLEPAKQAFQEWTSIRRRIAELERDEQDRLRMVDLWTFQKNEIDGARLSQGEDERLESEKRVLANAEKIYQAATAAYEVLYEGESSAAVALRVATRRVQELARYEAKWQECVAALESARITAEDVGASLRDYAAGVNASPERLSEIEDRLAALDRLKRKYGATLADVRAYRDQVAQKLNDIENKDELLKQLRRQLSRSAENYLELAQALSRRRASAAKKLERLVEQHMNDLAMKAQFRVQVTGSAEEANWTDRGFDHVDYLISTNPGQPLAPVERIASGGELSRIMLALKTSVMGAGSGRTRAGNNSARTLIFDEIDTGIGGRAAEAVGQKLKTLAATDQVLCVTHLPQIASFADQHYLIEKIESAGRTRTSLRKLSRGERAREVARMISGAQLTQASLDHAEQMLRANAG